MVLAKGSRRHAQTQGLERAPGPGSMLAQRSGEPDQTANEDPQPHLAVAMGLEILKAEPIRSAT